MKRGSHILKPLLATMAFAVAVLPGLGTDTTPVAQAADKMTIEVVMKDKAYKVTGHTLPGSLTNIVLKNEDTMEHGFTSPLLDEVTVHMEGEGISLVEKGVKASEMPRLLQPIFLVRGSTTPSSSAVIFVGRTSQQSSGSPKPNSTELAWMTTRSSHLH